MPPQKPPRDPARGTISSQIRDVIAARRLSATRLAADSGVDRRVLARWIAGAKEIELGTADRVAAALGLRIAEAPARKSVRPLTRTEPAADGSKDAEPEAGRVDRPGLPEAASEPRSSIE